MKMEMKQELGTDLDPELYYIILGTNLDPEPG